MFFVSEEFLRKYQGDEAVNQTIGEAVPVGRELFEDSGGKREYNVKRGKRAAPRRSAED